VQAAAATATAQQQERASTCKKDRKKNFKTRIKAPGFRT
jgi:hypothetical protein